MSAAGPAYYCHECQASIQPLLTPGPTCPRCNGQFVEELESVQATAADEDEDDEDDFAGMHPFFGGGVRGAHGTHDAPQLDIGGLLRGVLGNLASAGNEPGRPESNSGEQQTRQGNGEANDGQQPSSSSNFRSGGGRFGPLNFQWGYTTQGGGSRYNATFGTRTGDQQNTNTPPTLNEFLRGSFPQNEHNHRQDSHVHDDGMGGAGAAADGRFFNSDNPDGMHGDGVHGQNSNANPERPNYPPELAALRELFGNLFGGAGDGPAGALVNMLGENFLSGRSGDYVFGQQGLDDVITQLMDQTRGSTAPPPASEEVINKLTRFKRQDLKKVREARNRECSTCMDSFEDEEDRGTTDASMDSNRPVGAADAAPDDPPEELPDASEQQDDLVLMPCRHLFHEDCLVPWLKTSGTCPVCRVRLDGVPAQPENQAREVPTSSNAAAAATNISSASNNEQEYATTSGGRSNDPTPQELENETREQRRERMLRAAEARRGGQSIPGSFGQPPPADDLD